MGRSLFNKIFGFDTIMEDKKVTEKPSVIKALIKNPDKFTYVVEVVDDRIVLTVKEKEADPE